MYKWFDPITVIGKSDVEKPTNNPCKDLPTCHVASQDEIRPSQAEIVNPIFPSVSIETVLDTSTLGGQQGKDKGVGCDKTNLTDLGTGLTASSKILQNKSKPKMVKPKNPEISVWKTVESKGHHKYEKKMLKPNKELTAKSSNQKDIKHASQPKNVKQTPKHQVHHRNRLIFLH